MTENLGQVWEFLLLILGQFAGGPGPPENNLVRFGLSAVLWALLFSLAWSRQRSQVIPRERLLLWGFGLGLVRELFMFGAIAIQIWNPSVSSPKAGMHQPLEHALAMAAVIVVAGAFIRYILDDERRSRRFLQVGIGITVACLFIVSWFWMRRQATDPPILFHQTWEAWLFHLPLSILIIIAIVNLGRERGWLRNVVITALSFFLLSEILLLLNYATDRAFSQIICPIGNSLHILAIPLLGYVYLKEQSIEKKQAEKSLSVYRHHLKELVEERTTELKSVNVQLNQEIRERKLAESKIARRNEQLAAQNKVAATLSRSLDLDFILNSALQTVLSVLGMEVGFIFLIDPDDHALQLRIHRGGFSREALLVSLNEECLCRHTSQQAVENGDVVIHYADSLIGGQLSTCFMAAKLMTLVSIPLTSKDRAVGVMTLGASRAKAIQQADCALLIAIGQQIGIAIENATLYQDAEHWAGELIRLQQAGAALNSALGTRQIFQEIVKESTGLLHCQGSQICSWGTDQQSIDIVASYQLDPDDGTLFPDPMQLIPIMNELIRQHRTLVICAIRLEGEISAGQPVTGWKGNLICLPIRCQQQPETFLFLFDRPEGRIWRKTEKDLIENFVNKAELALINANLHNQMERTAALEERQRIAADMHDGLAQNLSLLGLKVDWVHELLESGEHQAAELELYQIREVIGRASTEARRSIASLQNPVRRQRSLQEQLTSLVCRFQTEYGTPLCFTERGSAPLILPFEQIEQAIPVVQEALLNAHRHAQAQKIDLILERYADEIKITVKDDGQGFNRPVAPDGQSSHFGLSIMQARATRMGGHLKIISNPGQGTRVILKWSQGREHAQVKSHTPEGMASVFAPEVDEWVR